MRTFVVDSFTDTSFRGNPAGVCLIDVPVSEAWMQQVAAELKHSETAFVDMTGGTAAPPGGSGGYSLRWFTPETEVDLCGHATLATAHVLADVGERGPFTFATRSGPLSADKTPDGLITMDFPANPAVETAPPAGLAEALGTVPIWTGRSRFDVLVDVGDESTVRGLTPDIAALAAVDARGVIVTAPADPSAPYEFVSRFFAPAVGVPEDPVTGSAHCALGPYWARALGRPDGTALSGRQLSRRGGTVRVTMRGERVELAGRAVTVLAGDLVAPA